MAALSPAVSSVPLNRGDFFSLAHHRSFVKNFFRFFSRVFSQLPSLLSLPATCSHMIASYLPFVKPLFSIFYVFIHRFSRFFVLYSKPRRIHIGHNKGMHMKHLPIGLFYLADNPPGIIPGASLVQKFAIHNGVRNSILSRQIIQLGIQRFRKPSQNGVFLESNDIRRTVCFKQAVD